MSRSQRHLIEQQGYDSSGDKNEQGALSPVIKVPTFASMSPATGVHGAANITVTATGTNFVAPMSVSWAGTGLPATVTSPTTLTFIAPISTHGFAVGVLVKLRAGPYETAGQNFAVT